MQRLHRIAAPALYLIFGFYAIWLSIREPFHNWDVIPYIALAKGFEQPDIATLQSFTYAELRRVLPTPLYEDLARENAPGPGRGGPYRHAASTDPGAFAELLPGYRARVLYIGAVYALYRFGIDIELATHLISGAMVAAGFGILYLLARRFLAPPLVYILPPLAILLGVLDLARFSTPDGFAFCAWMLCVWLFLNGYRTALLIALPVILAIRTDLVFFILPLQVGLLILDRPHWRGTAVSLASSLAVHFGLLIYFKFPATSLFACTLVTELRCIHPVTQPPELTLAQYAEAVATGLRNLSADANVALYAFLFSSAIYLLWERAKTTSIASSLAHPTAVLIVACLIHMVARFLVLPAEWQRAFPAPYLITAFCVLWLISERVRTQWAIGATPA